MGWYSYPIKMELEIPPYDPVTGDPVREALSCDICKRPFKTWDGLSRHMREKHTSPLCNETNTGNGDA